MTRFRPCIDLHEGRVKQIVGGSLRDDGAGPVTNFVSSESAGDLARRYARDGLFGGHVISLGQGNGEAAREALAAFPRGLAYGGGVTPSNARSWLEAGAEKVIVTSYLFQHGRFAEARLRELCDVVTRDELIVDLSCRRLPSPEDAPVWVVATDRWQTRTDVTLCGDVLSRFAESASEFLVHAVDVEGLCTGIDEALVEFLGQHSPVPCTYAGGGRAIEDLALVERRSGGRVDLTFGSALDIFGGSLVAYDDCVAWNRGASGGTA